MLTDLRARLKGLVHPAHMRLGLRAAVAAVAADALAYFLSLPNGYWAVLTAILVVQSSIGASLSVAVDRVLGTVLGGVIGVICALIAGASLPLTFALLGLGVVVTSTAAARFPSYKLAPVTVAIVLLSDPTHAQPIVSGFHRLFEIAVGGGVGLACALLIFPEQALRYLFPFCATALEASASLMEIGRDVLLGRPVDASRVEGLNDQARVALRAADARVVEARAERAGRLANHPDPAPVVRSCRRLWHSVIILMRSARQPLPEALVARMAPSFDATVAAQTQLMRALAGELRGAPRADLSLATSAAAALEGESARLGTEGALDDLNGATLSALFGAVSACTHVAQNLVDLSTRLAEMRAGDADARPQFGLAPKGR